MSGYTKGPWKAQQDCRSYRNTGIFEGGTVDRYGNPNAWAVYGATRIALLTEAESWLPQSEVDANARLIAASPALLAGVKDLLAELYMTTELTAEDRIRRNSVIEDARAALALAEGGDK